MSDCGLLGHPNLAGDACPCGERTHARRRSTPRPTFHLDPSVWDFDPRTVGQVKTPRTAPKRRR